jgi:N4-gp56 family major capsid protein
MGQQGSLIRSGETHNYDNGINTLHGTQNQRHYYDRIAIKAATEKAVYSQFCDKRQMPTKMGKEYRVSRWQRSFHNLIGSASFLTNGFISSRDIEDVTASLVGSGGELNKGGYLADEANYNYPHLNNKLNEVKGEYKSSPDSDSIDLGLTNSTDKVAKYGGGLLKEGSGPANRITIQKKTLSTQIARYGFMSEYSDEAELFSEDQLEVQMREELGELSGIMYEDLIQLDLLSNGIEVYSDPLVTGNMDEQGSSVTEDGTMDHLAQVNYDMIRRIAKMATRNRIPKKTSIVTGSVKVDTVTVSAAHYCIVGPEVKYDLENMPRLADVDVQYNEFAFKPVHEYADASKIVPGEIGQVHDIRFVESDTAVVYRGQGAPVPGSYAGSLSQTNGNFDVFPILLIGEGSFATIGLKGHGKMKFRSISPENKELGNAFGTKGLKSVSWWYGGLAVRPERIIKALVCASA